ncbi:Protein of unknown function DUF2800 [uncultured Caudovirales phage]|uniref:Uncharacterized protein n=1 Tax=uncultured Caudovirales phage TaxID=2100421 RepID=A0A6J5P1D2_9CAUD|nr:Protein of unknown function DUF2800 [uncultured Caudovirales phage]
MAHSPISPSSAHRWLHCQAAPLAEAGLPPSTSRYAAEGNVAHRVAADALETGAQVSSYFGRTFEQDGFEFEVDQEMVTAVLVYIDTLHTYGLNQALWRAVETQVPFGEAINQPGQVGTVDCLMLVGHELQVHDLKFGKGIEVDAHENPQLALYALGALHEFGDLLDVTQVRMVIHQPRLDHVSEWVISAEDLLQQFGHQARQAAANAMAYLALGEAPRDAYRPDGDVCRWCRAKAQCPALRGLVTETLAADVTADDFAPAPASIDLLARIYGRLSLVRDWCDAVEGEVRDRLLRGQVVDGWKAVAGRPGARTWSNPDLVEEVMRDSMRLTRDEMYTSKLASPTQVEKVLADQPKRWARLQPLIARNDTKPVIVPVTDKREAITLFEVTP